MSSRDKILSTIAQSQPGLLPLPVVEFSSIAEEGVPEKFIATLTTIGGKVIKVNSFDEIKAYIQTATDPDQWVITGLVELADVAELMDETLMPHTLQEVELVIIKAHFGVAENGAVWITEDLLGQRVLPFISQHLAVVLSVNDLVADMHQAYNKIGSAQYGFGTFIAGPSKTADIEQSLVLGAHGARSMTVFLMA